MNMGAKLMKEKMEYMIRFLHSNIEIFDWSHDDMSGIDHAIAVYRLNVDPG